MSRDKFLAAVTSPAGSLTKRVFWDVEQREPDVNSRPMSSEERLMAFALIKTIQDYKGVSTDGHEECVECHQKEHPGCFHEYSRNGEPYVLRVNKQCQDFHTFQRCAATWLASDAPDTGKGRTGWTFIAVCDALGLEPSYLRKTLAAQTSDAYWQDDAKIHAFLGFHAGHEPRPGEEASLHSRRSSEEGESD